MKLNKIRSVVILAVLLSAGTPARANHQVPPAGHVPAPNVIVSISCEEGASILRHRGFRRVEIVDCSGAALRYNIFALSRWYQIDVSRRGVLGRPIPITH